MSVKEDKSLIIYRDKNKQVEVLLKKETIWLDAHRIAYIFDVDRSVIVKHIRNIYKSGELKESSTCAKIAQVAADGKVRKMNVYNLDVIIAVGYRVNSKKATQFRIWATNVLRKYLLNGYVINQRRLTQKKLKELEDTIKFIKNSVSKKELTSDEAKGLLEVIEAYTKTWALIYLYDKGSLPAVKKIKVKEKLTIEEAQRAIKRFKRFLLEKKLATDIFGREREKGLLEGIINGIYQTFKGKELYKTFEEKAANLFYLIIKDHPFIDGNKRIATLLFLLFLNRNLSFREILDRFNDNTLVSLALLVAISPPQQKEIMINLITNFIHYKTKQDVS